MGPKRTFLFGYHIHTSQSWQVRPGVARCWLPIYPYFKVYLRLQHDSTTGIGLRVDASASCCAIVAASAQRQFAGMKTVDSSLVALPDAEGWHCARRGGDYVDNSRHSGIIPPMILTLDAKRRLTLPTNLLPAQPGDNFDAVFDPEEDAVIFRRLSKNTNWLTILKDCPVKMDDLPPRRREFPKRLKL